MATLWERAALCLFVTLVISRSGFVGGQDMGSDCTSSWSCLLLLAK